MNNKILLFSNWIKKNYWVFFILGLLALIIYQYYGLVFFHYHVPPGDDPANHLGNINAFYNNKRDVIQSWGKGSYPPLFHLLIAKIALLFNLNTLTVLNWFYPSIIVFASVSIFLTGYFLFNPYIGLLSFLIYGFTAQSSIQLLNDGGFPNLIATHIFLPLFVLFFIKSFVSKKKKYIWISGSIILSILILFTHHLTSFYLMGLVIGSSVVIFFEYILNKKNRLKKKIIVSPIFISLLAIIYYLYNYSLILAPMKNLAKFGTRNIDQAGIWGLKNYPTGIGLLVFFVGFSGLIIVLIRLFSKRANYPKKTTSIVLSVWSIMLLIGSRLHSLSNPERLARDLVVPLSILTAFAILFIFNKIKNKNNLTIIFLLLILLMSAHGFKNRTNRSFSYEPMIRFTNADMEAVNYLNNQKSCKILTDSYDFYLKYFLEDCTINYNFKGKLTNPSIKKYDYLYLVNNQTGWVPDKNEFIIENNDLECLNIEKINTYTSETNQISIYKIKK